MNLTGVLLLAAYSSPQPGSNRPQGSLSWLPALALALSIPVTVRVWQRNWQERANHYLGFFDERYVAECLDPLKRQGWFIFHDLPCSGASGKSNIDHAAVGPGGIWIIETKTHRKGHCLPGRKEYEIESDGETIAWPGYDDRGSVVQASDNARWLAEWLKEKTGKEFSVSAVLAFPGYSVIERKLRFVRAANPKKPATGLNGQRQEPDFRRRCRSGSATTCNSVPGCGVRDLDFPELKISDGRMLGPIRELRCGIMATCT